VVAGIIGLVLPAMPGPPLVFGGLLMAAWIEDFAYVGWVTLVILGLLAVLTYVVDFAAGALGATRFGASPRAVWGAVLGALAGIAFGPIGILVGPFVGALLGELSMQRSLGQASRAGFGATIGLVLGSVVKLTLAFTMLGVFLLARFF
jgi:uncharacterized protein YqgC (DUF456 family)